MAIYHRILMALAVLGAVAGCGRAESPGPAIPSANMPTLSTIATASPEVTVAQVPAPTTIAATPGVSLSVSPTAAPIPRRSTFGFHSDQVADWYKVYVSLPKGYDPQHLDGYPVIYVLDADWYFDGSSWRIGDGGVAGIVSSLSESGRIPNAIVIGIGYIKTNHRGRDFLWAPEAFYAFLTTELIPFVDGEYPTDASSPRTLVGHSDGAFFTLYAFFQTDGNGNTPFGQFIAISGDLTKNERLPFREEGKMNGRISDSGVVGGALFLAVGGQEESRFVTSMQDMTERLKSRQYENLRLQSRVYGSDDHASVVEPAVWTGLMWVLGE